MMSRTRGRRAASCIAVAALLVAACATSTDTPDDAVTASSDPIPTTAAAPTTTSTVAAAGAVPATTEAQPQVTAPKTTAATDELQAAETDETEVASDPAGEASDSATQIGRIRAVLDTLTVAPESVGGYDRYLFKHWISAGGGCDTRKRVLIDEAVRAPQIGSRCALSDGGWFSRYDGQTTDGTGRGFDVDHLVPLQEAWQSGARDWDPAERERYANYLDYPDALIAVSASSNRSKGAKAPAGWLPPSTVVHCWYIAAWIDVKHIFDLAIDQAEAAAALTRTLEGCDDTDLDAWPQGRTAPSASTETDTATDNAENSVDAQDGNCHHAYEPYLPNLPGDALNCGDLTSDQKPVWVKQIGVDPYQLDRDGDGQGCTS